MPLTTVLCPSALQEGRLLTFKSDFQLQVQNATYQEISYVTSVQKLSFLRPRTEGEEWQGIPPAKTLWLLDAECDSLQELTYMRRRVDSRWIPGGFQLTITSSSLAPLIRESETGLGSLLCWGLCAGDQTVVGPCAESAPHFAAPGCVYRCRREDNCGLPRHREAPAEVPAPGPPPGPRDGKRLQEHHLTPPGVPEPQHPGDWPTGCRHRGLPVAIHSPSWLFQGPALSHRFGVGQRALWKTCPQGACVLPGAEVHMQMRK